MTARTTPTDHVNVFKIFGAGYEAMRNLEQTCKSSSVTQQIQELVKMRASQINGCAYCLDMHYKDARAAGETEERLYMLPAWWESKLYTDAERAALALCDEMTLIAGTHVSPEVEAEARRQFDEETYAALLFMIATINAWNRLCITSHAPAGTYQPGQHAVSA